MKALPIIVLTKTLVCGWIRIDNKCVLNQEELAKIVWDKAFEFLSPRPANCT